MRRIARGRQLRIQLGENKGDKYANRWERKRIMCPNKHLERRTARERERKREREREREKKGHELERTRGISTETDRGQGAYCPPEAPRENSHM